MDQIRTLFHDLNSNWSIINYVAYFYNGEGLSQSDHQLYEEMFNRAKTNLQSALLGLLSCIPQQDLLIDTIQLTDQLEIQNLPVAIIKLKPIVRKLQQLVRELSES